MPIKGVAIMRIIIRDSSDKTYDRVFAILNEEAFLFQVTSDKEYASSEGYVIEFSTVFSDEAMNKISNLKGVTISY